MNQTALSNIIAGTMTWGIWGKNLEKNQMINLMHCCLENGITTFDHADIYGGYTTEADFGTAFSESGIDREKIQFISKCGIKYVSENRNYSIKHYDYSKEYIVWSVENSLKNLQTDYLDVLLLHRPSPMMVADEIAEAIEKLKREGKIKSFGVSNFTSSQTDLIRQKTAVDFNQIQFSATHFESITDGNLDYMQLHKIKPMSWNPLGSIFRAETEQTQRLTTFLKSLETKYNVAIEVLLLAWIMQHPSGVSPVIGTTNPERIKNSVKAVSIKLELEDWFGIWTESMGHKVP